MWVLGVFTFSFAHQRALQPSMYTASSLYKETCVRTLVLILAASLSLLAQDQPRRRRVIEEPPGKTGKPSKANLKLAADLIQRTQALTGDLNNTDRAYVLAKMAELTAKRDPEQSKAWAEEAFRLGGDLSGNARGSVQMNALMAVSQNDLDRALEMLGSMEAPRQTESGGFAPDIRGAAATMLFSRAFGKDGMKIVDSLESTARRMGENGFYPYMAVTELLRGVGEKDEDRAREIANSAVAYIKVRKRSQMENQQVVMFLRTAREYIPAQMMREILGTVITDALEQAKASDGTEVAATFENSKGQKAQLSSMASLTIVQLLPIVRDIDPEWAKKLEAQSDELRNASQLMNSGEGVSIMIGARTGGPNGPDGANRDFRDEVQAMQVDELASRDPQRAVETADRINDPVLHSAALVRATAAGSDAEARDKAIKAAKELLSQTSDPREKLTILSGLVSAQSQMNEIEGLSVTLQQGLSIADDQFRRSIDKDPSNGAWTRPGVEIASRLVRSASKQQGKLVAEKLESVRQQSLKALLLLAAVEALDPESHSTSGPQFRFAFN
jgi:hypothetical protein